MKTTTVLVGTLLVALTVIHTASSLDCYVCAGCNDPFNAKAAGVTKMKCSGSCMKVKADTIVGRSCSPTKQDSGCKEASAGSIKTSTCYCNDKDNCNGSTNLQVTMATALTIMASILRKFL